MTQPTALWGVLTRHAPKKRWVSTNEIYSIVESHLTLDNDDLRVRDSQPPKWKLNIRRLLQDMKKAGRIQARASR
jgi:hypothetical protein